METKNIKIGDKTYTVDVAQTEQQRRRGLSGRDQVNHDGMLFIHETPGLHGYWMKGTKIPLSIIFISPKGRVKKVEHRNDTNSLKITKPDEPIKFVLEVPMDQSLDSLKGESFEFMSSKSEHAKKAFRETIKEAELPDPLPEDFLEKVLRLPEPQRDQAIQMKLQDFGASMRQQIKNNISSALSSIRKQQIEEKTDELLSSIEGDN